MAEELAVTVEDRTLDTVEFCPWPLPLAAGGRAHVGVLGAYDLHADAQTRRGSLALFRVRADGKHKATHDVVEWPWRRAGDNMKGVLDFKWSGSAERSGDRPSVLGAAAQSHAQLSLWRLRQGDDNTDSHDLKLELLEESIFEEHPHTLTLSLDWNNRVPEAHQLEPAIIASYASGHLCAWRCTPAGLIQDHYWQAHSLEAWIAAYDHYRPDIIYSGGDDCMLKMWDMRMGTDSTVFNKRHDMGVTTISSHPLLEHTLATGSYDEMVSIWDKRKMSGRAGPLATRGTEGGGIWRIKWHPFDPSLIAVAAMHRGFFIMKWPEGSDDIEVVQNYTGKHTSLAYGVDWSYHTPEEGGSLVAGCSFYDKTFSVWRPALDS